MALPEFSMRQLLEAGAHFGHRQQRWNPKMAPFIYGQRNDIHILDLTQTVPLLHRALVTLRDVAAYVASVAGQGGFTSSASFASFGTDGAKIFKGAGCAGCHTLAAAGSTGTIGPNLDQLGAALTVAVVAHQVENGGGAMPAFKGKLSDAQIRAVAQYVSSSVKK